MFPERGPTEEGGAAKAHESHKWCSVPWPHTEHFYLEGKEMVVMTHCLFQAFPATKLKAEKG